MLEKMVLKRVLGSDGRFENAIKTQSIRIIAKI